MAVEYAGILAAVSLMAIALTGAYGRNVAAVFDTSSVGVTAVVKAAKAQKVSVAGAKAAYVRAPYKKPALKFLYGLGWIGGSSMSGESFWAIVGPIVAGLGVALIITIVGRARGDHDETDLDRRYGGRR